MIDCIFKRRDTGTWCRKWQESEGAKVQVKSLRTKNKERAQRIHHRLKDEKERELAGQTTPEREKTALQLPLRSHLATYLYEMEKVWKSEKHWQLSRDRIKKVLRETGWKTLTDITGTSFKQWRAKQDCCAKTLNEYRSALNTFVAWITEDFNMPSPLQHVKALPRIGKTFERLAMHPDEFTAFIHSVKDDNRRLCYLTAFYTGLRRNELSLLEWGDMFIDREEPYIRAREATTKNSKEGIQMLPECLVPALRLFRPENARQTDKVFDVPSMKIWKSDLKNAGIPYKDERGNRRDFHSVRVMCCTYMLSSGAAPIVTKEHMRHSDMKLTVGNYFDPRMAQKHKAVNQLPDFVTVHKNVYTKPSTGVKTSTKNTQEVQTAEKQKAPENRGLSAKKYPSVQRGVLAEREGFEPSVPRKQYTGLAVQHLKPLSHLSVLKTKGEHR